MNGRAHPLRVIRACCHSDAPTLPCEFLTVADGEFVWDRSKARAGFEVHLESESNKRLGRDETPLDAIWRATEATINDVVAHIPARQVKSTAKVVAMPENAGELLTLAIDESCASLGSPRGDFGHKRRGRRTVGFAAVMLRVSLQMSVVSKLLDRSDKLLWQAMKNLAPEQRAQAGKAGRALKPIWKKG